MKNKRKIILFFAIACIFKISAFAQSEDCMQDMPPKSFKLMIDSLINEIIIDVRPNEVFKNRKIQNAILVPFRNDLNNLTDTLDRDTPILVYCAIGMRSSKVSEILCEMNFNFVVNLKGGIDKWKRNGFETIELEK
ncbi:MAG: rhodanese-like domain-containing protein [Salinivirgaceae bacterium]|jgi:rhodanese-related sulfurtransferase|nr:rhodanese-like domain-containing protein [Salinivirgaceae bacterium]